MYFLLEHYSMYKLYIGSLLYKSTKRILTLTSKCNKKFPYNNVPKENNHIEFTPARTTVIILWVLRLNKKTGF